MRQRKYGSNRVWQGLLAGALLLLAGGVWSDAAAQEVGQIRGRVSDGTTGAPLSDVQVYLSGVNLGSISRQTGAYVIVNVPAGTYELRAERIGLTPATRQVTIAAGAVLEEDFQLSPQALGLDEIVVTGTAGAARRREVGNAVSQINTVDLPDRPTSVTDMLTAMAPGVEISKVGGGGELGQGSQITIRGINSINTNTPPIIFIDGIRIMSNNFAVTSSPDIVRNGSNNQPSPLDQLNPNDIERIEIISGPAASTLYGTEASAGVIQVFTRRGTERAPQWNAEVQAGTLWNQSFGAHSAPYIHMDPWICTGPFQCGEYMSVPVSQTYNLSVRGGAQALQYFVSSGYTVEEGSTPVDNLDRWNVRGNFTLNPLQDLVFQWNTAYTHTFQQNTSSGNNAGGLTLNVFRQDQNYFGTDDKEILNTIMDWDITQEIERFTTGGTLTYTPLANLTNRLTIGYDFTQQESKNVRPFGFRLFPQGGIDVQVYTRRYLSFDYVGTFSFSVLENLRSSFSWGGQSTGDFSARIQAFGEGFPGAAKPTVNSASSTLGFETRQTTWNSGFFFQNVLDLSNKYFLTLGLRVDGNSTFGRNFNLAVYPKASASWVLSDEDFWRPQFGEMKLRAAWGMSGRAPGALVARRTWSNTGLAGEPAFTPGNLGNPDIGPEVTTEIELGFDASWFSDRVRPRFTYYHQTTRDAIQAISGIPSLGFTTNVNFNIGEVQNFGKEYALDVTAVRTRNWGVDVGANLSRNANNVLTWAGENDPANSTRIGRPISYSTWTMYQNQEGMGTSRRTDGTYQAQSCTVNQTDEATGETVAVPRPGVDPTIHACSFSSTLIYGYPLSRPSTIAGINTSLRIPFGIALSMRGDFRGGPGYWRTTNAMGSAISRNVLIPVCMPYYQNTEVSNTVLRTDTPAIWVQRCHSAIGNGYVHKGNEFIFRSISATIPVDFAFPDRIQNARLTIVAGNLARFNHSLYKWYTSGSTERMPEATTIRASLQVNF